METPTNPYLNLQPGLTTTASLIAGTVMSKDTQRALKERGYTSSYAVGLVPDNGPMLLVSTTDTVPAEALATRDAVMDILDQELAAIQKNVAVPGRQLITLSRSDVGEHAEVLPGSKLRALVAVFALGVILTVLLAFLVDRLARVARRRSRERDGDGDSGSDEPNGVATLRRREPVQTSASPEPAITVERVEADGLRSRGWSREKKVGSGGRR